MRRMDGGAEGCCGSDRDDRGDFSPSVALSTVASRFGAEVLSRRRATTVSLRLSLRPVGEALLAVVARGDSSEGCKVVSGAEGRGDDAVTTGSIASNDEHHGGNCQQTDFAKNCCRATQSRPAAAPSVNANRRHLVFWLWCYQISPIFQDPVRQLLLFCSPFSLVGVGVVLVIFRCLCLLLCAAVARRLCASCVHLVVFIIFEHVGHLFRHMAH